MEYLNLDNFLRKYEFGLPTSNENFLFNSRFRLGWDHPKVFVNPSPSSGKSSPILFPSLWDEEKSKKKANLQRLSSLMTSSNSLGDFR